MANISPSGGFRPTLSLVKSGADAPQAWPRRPAAGERNDSRPNDSRPGHPVNVFTTSNLTIRAMDLAGLLDSIGQAAKAIEAADRGIEALTGLVESAQDLAHQALRNSATATQTRQELGAQFDGLRDQIDLRAADPGYKGVNLLDNGVLKVHLDEKSAASFTVSGVKFSASGLGIAASTNAWQSDKDINDALADLAGGLVLLRAQAAIFSSNLSVVQTREDFTQSLMDTLHASTEPLSLADQDEEAARLVTLSTRQQLATTALSLTTQSEQSILRLF